MKLSVIIPCYNEQEVLPSTFASLTGELNTLLDQKAIDDYEVIFVNDGSKDNTEQLLREQSRANPRVKIILFNSNFGHQAAILSGLLNSSGDAAVTIDADLQDPPSYLKLFVEQYQKGFDVVIGVRDDRSTDSFFKRFFAQGFYRVARLLGVPGDFNAGDYRLVSRRVLLNLREFPERNLYLRGLIPSMKLPTSTVLYKRAERQAGNTKYPFSKSLDLALNGITSFSVRPLRIVGLVGLLMFFASLGMIGWVIYQKFVTESTIVGWASIATIILFFNSLTFIFLSIIGEYIGKIYMETKARPRYVIKDKINFQ